jgi:hypothetical protein
MRNLPVRRRDAPARHIRGVMPGLVPGIHALLVRSSKGVDGRDKPGHDGCEGCTKWLTLLQ